nr:RNA-directed DNA polymerase, eukaryota, reverse transcriptase zinc-binding domain protein [Tanacetum cinerariifolium]
MFLKVWILGTLEESPQDQVVATPGNAKALWDHIKDLFHNNKDARAITLDGELRSIKLDSLTINAYCTKIKAMVDRLANLGEKVNDKNLVMYALNGLDTRVVMAKSNSDHNGWTWVFGKNKHHQTKPIDNPYVKDVEKIATSFFVTNFPNSLDAKNLWMEFQPFERIVDAFIANKRSKQGGLWVWLQFSSVSSCEAFKYNESLNKLWTVIKVPSPSFVVDEQVIWIEVSGLPLYAWGSSALKKIANLFGKFNFFDDDVEDSMCMGRAFITTKIQSLISEKVNVTIKDLYFNVHVKEIGTWSTLISDDMDSNESGDDHDMEKHRSTNEDVDPNAALDDFIQQNIVKESALKDFKEGDQANVSTHVAGDNETLFPGKSGDAAIFNDFVQEFGLIDLPMGGRSFTWMNKVGSKMSKLDRFLILDNVNQEIPNLQVVALDRIWSDHNPILLHLKKFDFGSTPFKIFHSWFDRIDFEKVVKDKWDDITGEVLGHTKSLHTKLKDLKSHFKIWYSHTKEVETSSMNLLLADMRNLDQKIDEGLASDEDKSSRIRKLQELDYFEKMNSMDLMQKRGLSGRWRETKILSSFMALSTQGENLNRFMDLLEAVVSIEEIKTAVWDCGSNKAPGVNSAFITLIPKVSNPLFIKDYRPISLIGLHYKIVAKILSNRLSKVVNSIISPEQSAFILGRKILDGPLILSEIIDWYKKRKKKMLFKVDFEKAFDYVSWKYLDYMLHKLGFGSTWRTWINNCLMSARTSILINGSPTSEFSQARYNRLFHLKNNKDCFISQRILNGSWEWDWCRPITMGRSKTKFDNLIIDISNMEIDDLVESNTYIWSHSNDDSFLVNSVRKHIDEHSLPSLFPCTRWKKMIPKNVNVFMWWMLLDRLPYRLNLSSHNLDIDSISCMVCNGHVESNDHIFFTCDTAVAIWNLVRSWIDLPLPSFLSVKIGPTGLIPAMFLRTKRAVCIPSLRLLVGLFGILGTISHSALIL